MNISITISQFELQSAWYLKELANLADSESNKQLGEGLNSVKWVAGHTLNTRLVIIHLITGEGQDVEFSKQFGKGSTGALSANPLSVEELIQKWNDVNARLMACLGNMTEEKLMSPPPFQASISDKTMHGFITYMAAHEAFHIGQMSVLRKLIK